MVRILVDAAQQAMAAQAVNATADEVFSAYYTMAINATHTALNMGANMEPIREVIARMYGLLPPEITH